jgi:hypothetical protein
MLAIIRGLRSGESFTARIDDADDIRSISEALPVMEATDRDTGRVDWSRFEDADLVDLDEPESVADGYAIVHRF